MPEEIDRLGAHRALVLSTPEQRKEGQEIVDRLGARAVGLFDQAVMHVPIRSQNKLENKPGAGCRLLRGRGRRFHNRPRESHRPGIPLPILSIPTTYAGSEMTPIWGITESGLKKTGRDPRVLPKTVLYDPTLTVTMPAMLSATSGMNSIAHCVEALYSKDANPIISMIAEEGIRALAVGLPVVVKEPANLEARSNALYGAWLGGISLGAVGMALHHKLCHTLGGTFNLPHAETHTVVLPHATAYSAPATPEAMSRIARALGAKSAAQGLYDLAASLGAPTSLAALGLKAADLDKAADIAVQNPYYNPRPTRAKASEHCSRTPSKAADRSEVR